MKHKGYINCVHHKTTLKDDLGLSYKCLKGNQKEYNLWWQNNGHKKSDDDMDEMPCFEQSDVSKAMDRMHNILDEMLDLVKDIKEK